MEEEEVEEEEVEEEGEYHEMERESKKSILKVVYYMVSHRKCLLM